LLHSRPRAYQPEGLNPPLDESSGAGQFRDNPTILPDDDAIGIGLDFDRTADGAGVHRLFVVIEARADSL
jgi:hypothetical protein